MLVLGIETSCDETSISVVRAKKVLSNVVTSSVKLHEKFGGVVPEVACRHHVEYILHVLGRSLKEAGVKLKDLDLISVTYGPGLVGALLVGITLAKSLSFSLKIPLVGVNHLVAHVYSNMLDKKSPAYPFIGLIISGGHTSLYYVKGVTDFKLLGQTTDDAIGESYDKVAKMLGLGYPGGPVIERAAEAGDAYAIDFPMARLCETFDFSFSGIKTAVLYYVRKITENGKRKLKKCEIADIAASFQEAANGIIIKKSLLCAKSMNAGRIVIGGGVSANKNLRTRFLNQAKLDNIDVYFPEMKYCLDNGSMVALLGEELYKKGIKSDFSLTAEPNLVL